MKIDKRRGTGRTTRQMESTPKNGVYVWVNGELSYPKQLAEKIDRMDLKIVAPNWLENGWRGVNLTGLTIDHAAWGSFGDEKLYTIQQAMMRVRS